MPVKNDLTHTIEYDETQRPIHLALIGQKFKFHYPPGFSDCKGHAAHSGETVTIIGLSDGYETQAAMGDPMFKIEASDGWKGDAWQSELSDKSPYLGVKS